VLTDGVITLRPLDEGDLDALYVACQDPEIARWTSVPAPYHREDAIAYLDRVVAEEAAGKWRAFLAVDEGEALLGSFALLELARGDGYGEIGYWVAKSARGKGVASRAVRLLRDWAVDELGLTLIELLIHEDNTMSRRVAERTGFLDTGERRPAPRQDPPGPPSCAVYTWSPA
jgi:RimJ/RimL family protein N-acetyltransferase